jgi:lipid II:glycine glycyltransferase (peptidoglycan interpeptide bridge formation enzyme)
LRVSPGSALGPKEWDQALLRQPDAGLLQGWRWGELQSRFGWRIERLVFDGGAGGVCSLQLGGGVVPGTRVAYVARGPAVASASGAAVLEAIESRTQGATVLRIEPPAPPDDPIVALLEERAFARSEAVQPEATLQLDLSPDQEELRRSFKPKTRYNLSLAERRGIRVRAVKDVGTFAALSAQTARRQGISLPGAPYYQAALEIFEEGEAIRLYLAEHEGRALAGIMVFRFGPTAYYLFGGSSEEGRELMPNYLLHWTAMLDFKSLGCRTYDWWGIPEEPAPDHPWFGLYRFKTGFGGEKVVYAGLYQRVRSPWRWALETRLRKLKRRLRGPILR